MADAKALSDHELMASCAKGAMDAFGELVGRYKEPIIAFLFRYTGDYRAAEDLAQETFIRVFKKIPEYNTSAKFSTWLYTIASNLAKDRFKYQRRHPAGSLDQQVAADDTRAISDLGLADESQRPDGAAVRGEMREIAGRALAALDDDEREILVLRDVQGLPYDEIAQVLGAPLGTVKSRVNRARLAFKEKFKELYHVGDTSQIVVD